MLRWSTYLLLPVLVTVVLVLRHSTKAIDAASPWIALTPELKNIASIPSTQLPLSLNGNRDCQPREIITHPARSPIQTKQSYQGCTVDTAYGSYDSVGYLQRPGTTTFGRIVSSSGATTPLLPIPYSSTGIAVSSGAVNGSYLFFIKDLDRQLSTSIIYNGELTHTLPAGYSGAVKDVSGRLLSVDTESLSFSNNGLWAVASLPGIGVARINTSTFEVLPFGDSVNYNVGAGPAYRTAISSDGRYAVVASMSFEIMKLYDLSTCEPVPVVITAKVLCQSRDLLSFMRQKVLGYRSIIQMRFFSNFTIDLYVSATSGSNITYTHQVMSVPGQENASFQYLGLGDSFASGEGAYQYKAATDTTQNKCHLSQRSYPYLIATMLEYEQYESVACSGAKLDDLLRNDDEYTGQVNDGKRLGDRNITEVVSNLLPGYVAQNEFTTRYKPGVITVSAVGNDIGFSDKIKRCLDTDTCYSSYEDRLEIVNEVNAQFYRLTNMYAQLKRAARPDTRIYVIGYPEIGDPDGNCADNVRLNHDELVFAQQLVRYLNRMIKTAAANQGVFYVDVEQAFTGHRLCETNSWNVAINGLTAGNDIANIPFIHGPVGNESYHPNAYGHELFKDTILAKTSNLTYPMPQPNSSATMPEPSPDLDILQAPKANRPVKIIRNVTGTNEGVIGTGKTWITRIIGIGSSLKPGSSLHAWLNSTPVDLGTFTPDANGDLDLGITLPNSVPSSFHTLHLYGKNTSDEDLDFYMTVYVSNGETTACSGLPSSGHDQDKDGFDDACDAFIDQTPTEPIVVEPPEEQPRVLVGQSLEQPVIEVAGQAIPAFAIVQSSLTPISKIPDKTGQPAPMATNSAVAVTDAGLAHVAGANTSSASSPQLASNQNFLPPSTEKFNNWLLALVAIVPLGILVLRRYHKK